MMYNKGANMHCLLKRISYKFRHNEAIPLIKIYIELMKRIVQ
ncbi:hypothetical protein KOEU_33810 [Komagataeibacter europaeus]|uniref:Uncharacterized protein n=2 Tax=Komagataeibacter TaxID=1434011 RepID=A0A0N0MH72_9PROT|nr:hypothetical protein H845_3667 [Komagataeibacter xylinus E25]KON63139.1 hypothetical protein KOEU_33810 [Komagataeibacter europaeus]KPH88774.1 hypothetical protein GLUCOINTEAF2_0203667 [Komagataeibacter intermedius AF2]